MKIFWLTTILSFFGIATVSAQYAVGDIFEKDDIKAVVFYVDETGEHGLAITLGEYENSRYLSNKDIKNQKAEIKTKQAGKTDAEKKLSKAQGKVQDQMVRKYYAQLIDLVGIEGKKNAEIIKQFCEANKIDMATYFPAQCWAESLGEGWFVPGEKEAILYSNYIASGVGKPAYKGINKKSDLLNKYNEVNNALRANSGYEHLSLYDHINTSSIGRNNYMYKEFICYKSLEPRLEQRKLSFGFSFLWFYDIDAYFQIGKLGSWINKQKVAVYEF